MTMTTNHPLTAHSNRASFLRPKPTHTYIMCMSSARDMCVTHLGSIAHCIYAEPIGDLVLDARIMTQFVSHIMYEEGAGGHLSWTQFLLSCGRKKFVSKEKCGRKGLFLLLIDIFEINPIKNAWNLPRMPNI